jgi:Outer membrane protein beta-barrel domain
LHKLFCFKIVKIILLSFPTFILVFVECPVSEERKVMLKIIIPLIFLLNANFVFPQVKLGPDVGLNINFNHGDEIQNGAGVGLVVGCQIDLSFTKVFAFVLNSEFYDNRSGNFKTEDTRRALDSQGRSVLISIINDESQSIAYLGLEPLIKIQTGKGFHFLAGPAFSFNVQKNFEIKIHETLPPGYDGTGAGILNPDAIVAGSYKSLPLRISLKLGMGWDISAGIIDVTPQIFYDLGLNNTKPDLAWKISTLQFLAGIKFKL